MDSAILAFLFFVSKQSPRRMSGEVRIF